MEMRGLGEGRIRLHVVRAYIATCLLPGREAGGQAHQKRVLPIGSKILRPALGCF